MILANLARQIRAFYQRRSLDETLDEELRFHLELETEKNIRRGHSPAEAARQARVSLGGMVKIKEEYREVELVQWWLDAWQDLRYASRVLWRSRSFTIIAILMLALGIGANTAIFSVLLTVLIQPLPYRDADRIVWLSNRNTALGVSGAFLNPADILDFREQSHSFERIAAWGTLPQNLYGARTPERVEGVYVTANFFRTLGVQPQLGRDFSEANEPDNSVIISHGLWLRQFGGDSDVVGKEISLGLPAGQDVLKIIGVLPAETNFPMRVDLFTMAEINRAEVDRGGSHNWRTIARLKPGVTIAQAQAEVDGLARRQEELYPDTNKGWQVQLQPLRLYLFGNSRAALLLLVGAVAMVLMIAWANVTNLQLGRAYARRREFALRLALGARRARLIRPFLFENLLLSILGGSAGVIIEVFCLSVVRTLGPDSVPRLKDVSLNVPVLLFAFALSLLSGVVLGLAPAFQASAMAINDALKHNHTPATSSRPSNRFRRTLVVVQVALAVILTTGAGLVVKSFWRLQAVDPGLKADGLLTAGLSLSFADYPNGSPKRAQLFQRAIDRLSTLPGVTSVGAISHLPLGGRTMKLPFKIAGQPNASPSNESVADYRVVSPSYFKAAGISLKRGRMFDESDHRGAPQVFVVNEAFARTFLSGIEPVGVRLDGDAEFVRGEIIGVVANVRHQGVEFDADPAFYVSYEQSPTFPIMNFVVRTETNPSSLIVPVRRELEALDPRGVVFNVRPFDDFIADAVATRRFNLWLFTAFGLLAVLLAAAGIHAMMSFAVLQRKREIGIRIALGAQKHAVVRLILAEATRLVGLGLLIGFCLSLALTQWMKSILFAVGTTDPLTYVTMGGLVISIALLACWIPARRATTINPIRTLRAE